jgi:hypothetical protein
MKVMKSRWCQLVIAVGLPDYYLTLFLQAHGKIRSNTIPRAKEWVNRTAAARSERLFRVANCDRNSSASLGFIFASPDAALRTPPKLAIVTKGILQPCAESGSDSYC